MLAAGDAEMSQVGKAMTDKKAYETYINKLTKEYGDDLLAKQTKLPDKVQELQKTMWDIKAEAQTLA